MSVKTTLYLPAELKHAVEEESRRSGLPEAEVIRRAIAASLRRPRPRPGIITGEPFAERADELLAGFGE